MTEVAFDPPPAALLVALGDPETAEAAAAALLDHSRWLRQPPPDAVLVSLTDPRQDMDGQIVRLARAWDPRQLVPPLLELVGRAETADRRIRAAWIVKQVTDPDRAELVLRRSLDPRLGPIERRYLIEGVVRAGSGLGSGTDDGSPDQASSDAGTYDFVRTALDQLLASPEDGTREAAVALVEAAVRSPTERRRRLIEALADESAGVVATALTALRGTGTDGIPPALLTALSSRDPTIAKGTRELVAPSDL